MTIKEKGSRLHWNYFLALEADLVQVSRYIEFTRKNFRTFSIELAHLLLASASEVDVISKGICTYLEPQSPAENIFHYRQIITRHLQSFPKERVFLPRFGLKLHPWSNWKRGTTPLWWQSYNKVKHERHDHFEDANLTNVLNSLAGLLVSVFYLNKLRLMVHDPRIDNRDVTRVLRPEADLLRLEESYYYGRLLV